MQALAPLESYFDFEAAPLSVISWVDRSKSAALLRHLQDQGRVLAHKELDEMPPGPARAFLRDLLVFTEVLPSRGHDFDDTGAWLRVAISGLSAPNAATVRRFTLWRLLRRARQREPRPSTKKRIRSKVGAAVRFLSALEAWDLPLASLRQRDVDDYLATHPPSTYLLLRDFFGWARREGLIGPITLPMRPKSDPGEFLSGELRWAALRRCVSDNSVSLQTRAAAALLLLYGLTPMVISRLTCDQVNLAAGETSLMIGSTPLPLPDSVGALILRQMREAGRSRTTQWVFPGQNPGRPINAGVLAASIKNGLGVRSRLARNAALASLAADLPVPVLAGFLNLANTTAARWANLVQGQWDEYIAVRVKSNS